MSSDITTAEQALNFNNIYLSAIVLFLFDCTITLSQEIEVIWARRWNTTTWLYAIMRYSLAVDVIGCVMPVWTSESCKFMVYIDQAVKLMQYPCLAWFSALRVYALLDGKYFMTALVLLLNVVPFAANIFNYATSIVLSNGEECTSLPGGSNALILSLSLATRISVIIGDVLVLAVTWTKTAQAYREARRLNIRAPLATMLFRDGTVYFLILLVLNIFQMIEDNVPVFLSIGMLDSFFVIAQPMIVCHFILNLRQIKPAGSSWASANQSRSLRLVGNMGQSLQFGAENGEEEDVEVDEEYVRRNYDTEQESTYVDV